MEKAAKQDTEMAQSIMIKLEQRHLSQESQDWDWHRWDRNEPDRKGDLG